MVLDVENKHLHTCHPFLGVAGTTLYLRALYSIDTFNQGFHSILDEKEKDGNRLGQSMEMVP